jgi:predicted CXXCH cytochrome family protein
MTADKNLNTAAPRGQREVKGMVKRAVFLLLVSIPVAVLWQPSEMASGDGGVYRMTAHGDSAAGVLRVEGLPRGDCAHCHEFHGTDVSPFDFMLWREDDNDLCFTCHSTESSSGIFPGLFAYQQCAHRTSFNMIWPGPQPSARTEPGANGKCVNCHDPHGSSDFSGLIDALVFSREETLCFTCHDGSPAEADIYSDFLWSFRHPAPDFSGRHTTDEGADPSKFGFWPQDNRHSECSDCHNAHRMEIPAFPPSAPDLPPSLVGVSRILVTNSTAGTVPIYTFVPANDTTTVPAAEYQICFKCHSSWTTQPTGQADLSILLNPHNASYHPVEAQGADVGIHPLSFAGGWGTASATYCSDCHRSNSSGLRGPHGSEFEDILAGPYPASSVEREPQPDDFCFLCHNFDTYANKEASETVTGYSRWNEPEESKGHTYHVEKKGIHCYSCHDSHGSPQFPHLIVVGRKPGLNSYTHEPYEEPNGGRCFPTCHGDRSYGTNY